MGGCVGGWVGECVCANVGGWVGECPHACGWVAGWVSVNVGG